MASITLALNVDRSDGNGPLLVFFDAVGTTSTGVTKPYGHLHYKWDFGDGTFAYGPLAAKVFPFRGSDYTVTCTATHNDGTTASATQVISVTDPDVAFAATDTVCFSTDGDFTGAPTDAQQITTTSFTSALDFLDAVVAPNPGLRLLFKRGDTFNCSIEKILDRRGFSIRIGAFGATGTADSFGIYDNDPIIDCTGLASGKSAVLLGSGAPAKNQGGVDDFVMEHLRFQNGSGKAFAAGRGCKNVLIHKVRSNIGGNCDFSHDLPWFYEEEPHQSIGYHNCDFTSLSCYSGGERLSFVGTTFQATNTDWVVRISYAWKCLMSGCTVTGPTKLTKQALKFHGQQNIVKSPPDPGAPRYKLHAEWVLCTGTTIDNTNGGQWTMLVGPQSSDPLDRPRNIIVEKCIIDGGHSAYGAGIGVRCPDTYIRNNQFIDSGTTANDFNSVITQVESQWTASQMSGIEVHHNSRYSTATNSSDYMAFVAANLPTVEVKNNIQWAASSADSGLANGTGVKDVDGNLTPATDPLFVSAPTDLTPGAPAQGIGVDIPTQDDFANRMRPVGATGIDAGSIQTSAKLFPLAFDAVHDFPAPTVTTDGVSPASFDAVHDFPALTTLVHHQRTIAPLFSASQIVAPAVTLVGAAWTKSFRITAGAIGKGCQIDFPFKQGELAASGFVTLTKVGGGGAFTGYVMAYGFKYSDGTFSRGCCVFDGANASASAGDWTLTPSSSSFSFDGIGTLSPPPLKVTFEDTQAKKTAVTATIDSGDWSTTSADALAWTNAVTETHHLNMNVGGFRVRGFFTQWFGSNARRLQIRGTFSDQSTTSQWGTVKAFEITGNAEWAAKKLHAPGNPTLTYENQVIDDGRSFVYWDDTVYYLIAEQEWRTNGYGPAYTLQPPRSTDATSVTADVTAMITRIQSDKTNRKSLWENSSGAIAFENTGLGLNPSGPGDQPDFGGAIDRFSAVALWSGDERLVPELQWASQEYFLRRGHNFEPDGSIVKAWDPGYTNRTKHKAAYQWFLGLPLPSSQDKLGKTDGSKPPLTSSQSPQGKWKNEKFTHISGNLVRLVATLCYSPLWKDEVEFRGEWIMSQLLLPPGVPGWESGTPRGGDTFRWSSGRGYGRMIIDILENYKLLGDEALWERIHKWVIKVAKELNADVRTVPNLPPNSPKPVFLTDLHGSGVSPPVGNFPVLNGVWDGMASFAFWAVYETGKKKGAQATKDSFPVRQLGSNIMKFYADVWGAVATYPSHAIPFGRRKGETTDAYFLLYYAPQNWLVDPRKLPDFPASGGSKNSYFSLIPWGFAGLLLIAETGHAQAKALLKWYKDNRATATSLMRLGNTRLTVFDDFQIDFAIPDTSKTGTTLELSLFSPVTRIDDRLPTVTGTGTTIDLSADDYPFTPVTTFPAVTVSPQTFTITLALYSPTTTFYSMIVGSVGLLQGYFTCNIDVTKITTINFNIGPPLWS